MRSCLLPATLLVIFLTDSQCDDAQCVATVDGWFYVSDDKLNHDDAATYCRKLIGKLAILDTKEKSDAAVNLIKKRDQDTKNVRSYLIGAKQKFSLISKKYFWEDSHHTNLKAPCSYVNWCKGEPSSILNRCAVVEFKNDGYCWSSADCGKKTHYLCEH